MAGSRYWLPEILARRAGNFPYKRAKRSASYTCQSLSWPAFFWITFHFTSSVCLCVHVGHKMKTCTQISEFRVRGKINVVNPGDPASPVRRAGFSHINTGWNPALLLGLVLPRGLALLHINTPSDKHFKSATVTQKFTFKLQWFLVQIIFEG